MVSTSGWVSASRSIASSAAASTLSTTSRPGLLPLMTSGSSESAPLAQTTSRPGSLWRTMLGQFLGLRAFGGDDFDLHDAARAVLVRCHPQIGLPALCMNSRGKVVWKGGMGIDRGKGMIGLWV